MARPGTNALYKRLRRDEAHEVILGQAAKFFGRQVQVARAQTSMAWALEGIGPAALVGRSKERKARDIECVS